MTICPVSVYLLQFVGIAHFVIYSASAETRHKVSAPCSVTVLQSFLSYGLVSATAETEKAVSVGL